MTIDYSSPLGFLICVVLIVAIGAFAVSWATGSFLLVKDLLVLVATKIVKEMRVRLNRS